MRIKTLIFFFSLVSAQPILACASCGSGGEDPLVLYPNESQKFYIGVSRASNFDSINESGNVQTDTMGPKNKSQVQLSYGMSFGTRSFVTVGIPLLGNSHTRNSEYGFGDPMLSGRYTVLPMTLANEYRPQVQLLASYKPAIAKSIHTSKDPDGLDIFGSGYTQYRIGLDIWSGMTWLQYGMAQTFAFSGPRTVGDHKLQPGMEYRTVFSLGHTFEETAKFTMGLSRTYASEKKDNNIVVENSQQINNALFVTWDYFVDTVSTVRLTLARQAAVFHNTNTLRSDSLSVAYMRAF